MRVNNLKNKVISIIGNIMFWVLIVTILISAFLFANSDSKEKSIFGYRYYNVITPSMTPTISVGSAVFVKMVDPTTLKEGDIITYSTSVDGKVVVTHRINKVINDDLGLRFITKGDANNVTDLNPVKASYVIGKVNLFIPHLGNILVYMQERIWLVVAGIISIMVIIELISYLISSKKNKKVE